MIGSALRAHRVEICGVPYGPEGPDPEQFAQIVETQRPRLYLTNSALHNPTGARLSPQRAHRILSIAAAADLTIVEDDTFADLAPEATTRLSVLDGLARVLRIGGFSKTLSASVRCGYIAGRLDWIEALVDLQVATSFGGPSPVATDLLTRVLTGGSYRKHLADLHRRLATARRRVADRLAPLGITPALMPEGGFYLWCQFPNGIDTSAVAQMCLEEDVILAPGNVFSPAQGYADYMRFNVAQMQDDRIYTALARSIERLTQ